MTNEEERAEGVIRAGKPVEARDWTCVGGDGVVTIPVVYPDGRPGRPAGIHGTFVLVDEDGKAGKPVDVWAHARARCIAKILGLVSGETPDAPAEEAEPATPIRSRREKEGREPPSPEEEAIAAKS